MDDESRAAANTLGHITTLKPRYDFSNSITSFDSAEGGGHAYRFYLSRALFQEQHFFSPTDFSPKRIRFSPIHALSLNSSSDAPTTTAAPPANKKHTISDVSEFFPNTLAVPLSISSTTTYLHSGKRGDVPSPRTPLPFNPGISPQCFSTLPSLLLLVHYGREPVVHYGRELLVHLRARIDMHWILTNNGDAVHAIESP